MNTPNKLTVARMILVPFLVLFMLTDLGGEANRYIALAIFVVASVTDWFDGKLARKYNLVTNFGKFMDPLADKLLVCSAMICFIELEKLPAWFVIIIIGREFIISGFRLIAAENGIVIAANYWGKFKNAAAVEDTGIPTAVAGYRFGSNVSTVNTTITRRCGALCTNTGCYLRFVERDSFIAVSRSVPTPIY